MIYKSSLKYNVFIPKNFYSSKRTTNFLVNFFNEKNLKPIQIYNDLHLTETKKLISDNTKNLSGIYLIFNNETGHYYVGSAATNRFYARFSNHLLYFRGSKILKHAVKKYKLSNFSFVILELFADVVTRENNKLLLDIEDWYLKSLLPDYNILTEAGSSFGYKHTEITRLKMKTNYSLERRNFLGNLNRDKYLSDEVKLKLSEKHLKKGIINYSEQGILNMKKKSKSVTIYNLQGTVYENFFSITEASKNINCSQKTIYRALKNNKKLLKKYIVKYT